VEDTLNIFSNSGMREDETWSCNTCWRICSAWKRLGVTDVVAPRLVVVMVIRSRVSESADVSSTDVSKAYVEYVHGYLCRLIENWMDW